MKAYTQMNELCDKLITDMTEAQEDTALLTGVDSFNTIKDVKPLATERGQFNGKATIAWNRNGQWLQFTFKKDEDCESGWAITARWLADKPKWISPPKKEKLVPIYVPEHLVEAMRKHLGKIANSMEVES